MKKDLHKLNQLSELVYDGLTLAVIGLKLNISRQRVYQLLKANPDLMNAWKKATAERKLQAAIPKWEHKERVWGGMSKKEFLSDPLREAQYHRLLARRNNSFGKFKFDLAWGDLEWPTNCPVLGIPLDYYAISGRRIEASASFDRIDSTLGYIPGNVKVISWRANRIKNDGTADEHRKIAEYIDKHY